MTIIDLSASNSKNQHLNTVVVILADREVQKRTATAENLLEDLDELDNVRVRRQTL